MSEDIECDYRREECESGAPAWVMTFADLMSLLLCFFVLLLTFSEMDAQKFRQIAGSMRMAFGVQRDVQANDIPMGTSIIAQEFSPGRSEPTPLDEVRQVTSKEEVNLQSGIEDVDLQSAREKMEQVAEEAAEKLRLKMQQEIDEGLIEVDSMEDKIVIRIKEKGSFPSGSAEMHDEFMPVLERIREQIINTPGTITVAGHTDDVPISTFRYRSNWELSSSRAVSVLEQLLKQEGIKPENTEVKGLADTQPLAPNDSPQNRARNRRVEIIITPGGEGTAALEQGVVYGTSQPGLPSESEPVEEPPPEQSMEPQPAPQGDSGAASIVPPLPEPIVIQDDSEEPTLQPELAREIEDLFGELEKK